MPKGARTVIKIAIAAALMAFIAGKIDFAAAFALTLGADPVLLMAGLIASLAIILADALYWTQSMRAVGCRLELKPALAFSIAGWFFANLAPSSHGADIFRAAQMRYAGAPADRAVRFVVAARLMSFASLLLVIGAGLPVALKLIDAPAERAGLILTFAIAAGGFLGFIILGPMAAQRFGLGARRQAKLAAAFSTDTLTLALKTSPAGWFHLTAQHLLRVAGVGFIAAALGVPVSAAALFALIPAALLVAMIPISFGGWGVREASFVHFLGFAGVAPAAALAISVVYGLMRVVIAAAGGLVWAGAKKDLFRAGVEPVLTPVATAKIRIAGQFDPDARRSESPH